jgi:MFS family permease
MICPDRAVRGEMVLGDLDPNQRRILVFTSAAHFLTHFFVLVFPALVMPISRDLSMEPARVIPLSFPMYLCYGVLAIPWGYLSDRFGPRWILGAGMLIAGAGFTAAGLTRSAEQLSIALAVIGVGCSAYHPSGLALLSKGMHGRGRALGINGLWGNAGIAAAPLAAGALTYALGWKSALLAFGFTGIALGLLCFAVPFSVSASDLQRGTVVERRQAVRYFLILCAAMIFSGLMYRGYTIILPTFFEAKLSDFSLFASDSVRLSSDTHTFAAAIITSGVYLVGMAGQLLGGRVADRFELRWAYLAFFASALPFLLLMSIVEGLPLVLMAGGFVLFSLGMQPIENSLVAVLSPPQWRSVSYGIKFTLVFGAGSLAVYLVGFLNGRFVLDALILLLVAFLAGVITMISVLLIASRKVSLRHETG